MAQKTDRRTGNERSTTRETKGLAKKHYVSPRLAEYGNVVNLTRNGGGSHVEPQGKHGGKP